jgi:hypothetical protein
LFLGLLLVLNRGMHDRNKVVVNIMVFQNNPKQNFPLSVFMHEN